MERREKLEGVDPRLRLFGGLFLLTTRLETMGNGPDYLGELTTKQWFLMLNLLQFFDRPPSIGELAGQMGTSHQNVKAIAVNLEKKGFVRLMRDEKDARVLRVCPDEKCGTYFQGRAAEDQAFVWMLTDVLTPEEIETLDHCLFRLADQANRMSPAMIEQWVQADEQREENNG